MKNLNVRKKLMKLAMINTFTLVGLSSEKVYAANEETVDTVEFEDIRDIVIAKENEVAIMSGPDTSSNLVGILEPGDHLKLITDNENYYEVLYRGKLAYVHKNAVDVSTKDEEIEKNAKSYDTVVARNRLNIKKQPTEDSETVGVLRKKEALITLGKSDGYYEVLYNDENCYVLDNEVDFRKSFDKLGYTKEDADIYDVNGNKIADIKKEQTVRIYNEKETDDKYYFENEDITGYINKDDVNLFEDIYSITDISDQVTEVYKDNELLLSTAVVTGKPPKHSTPTGIFYIGDEPNEITDHRDLVGANYRSYVEYMMTFEGKRKIGYHSSERGYDDRGKYFGWRDSDEYGEETYKTNGSHACVNLPNAAATKMYNIFKPYVVDQGNKVKVLIKE